MRMRWWTWALLSTWVLCCACAAAAPAEERQEASAPATFRASTRSAKTVAIVRAHSRAAATPATYHSPSHVPAVAVATTLSTPSSLPDCDSLLLFNAPPLPANVREHEAAVVHTAWTLFELIEQGVADERHVVALARDASRASLSPPPVAVALGAPELQLDVLYVVEPPRLVIFQQNHSAALQPFWRTLASARNASSVVWSNAWLSCETEGRGWWAGAAAAKGAGPRRAAAAIFRRIQALPCEDAMNQWLGEAPRCDSLTTECMAVPSDSIKTRLQYSCRCLSSHWHEQGSGWWSGKELAKSQRLLACTACNASSEAAACLGDTYNVVPLSANIIGMLLCLIIGVIIFKKRKWKAVAMGMWPVLEVVLLGALSMYGSAATQYMSRWRCILGPWLRELGFVTCYGSMMLRLWVLLAEFRARKAHLWKPRDAEVLRIVAAMVIGCVCYLSAFTAMATSSEGVECAHAAWHHVTAVAEMLLLAVGARIAYSARNSNVPYQERGWLATALCLEGACGAAWRVAALLGAAPERSPLAATVRAHLSSGVALACVLAPRLWHGYRAASRAREVSRRGSAEEFDAEREEELTSEEMHTELKRVYAELEILRNQAMRKDNPHISKRRGGRKPSHSRFSLQALQARHGGNGNGNGKSGTSTCSVEVSEAGDATRSPEDSVCAVAGPSHYTNRETQV